EAEGASEKAERILRDALSQAMDNPAYMVALAALLRRRGRQADGEYYDLLARATTQAPDFPGIAVEQSHAHG
ncbi:MAG: hypothetical protein NXI02_32800, partial [Rhodobacteraceae bacterium]|nr:hypothetical protein [Paracoccaceae bacterium]